MTTIFVWQLAQTLLSLGLALVGIVVVLRSPERRAMGVLCLAALGYACLTISLFGFDAYYRCRFPALPYLYLFTGVGAAYLTPNRLSPCRLVADDLR